MNSQPPHSPSSYSGLKVRNTFLESDEGIDCLESSFERAVTEPTPSPTQFPHLGETAFSQDGFGVERAVMEPPRALQNHFTSAPFQLAGGFPQADGFASIDHERPPYLDEFAQHKQQHMLQGQDAQCAHPHFGVPTQWPSTPETQTAPPLLLTAPLPSAPLPAWGVPQLLPQSAVDAASNSPSLLPWIGELMDVGRAAQAAGDMSRSMSQQATLAAIEQLQYSVTLSDPAIPDQPLIGCSDGFETLTGYSKKEIVGRNCRFLNMGVEIDRAIRMQLREAAQNGTEFIGVICNVRKTGEIFQNLLHMTSIFVRDKRYIVGVQADVTNIDIDVDAKGHREMLQSVAERIFAGNVDAWIRIQAREFSIRLPAPYSQLLRLSSPARFAEELDAFVRIQQNDSEPITNKHAEETSDVNGRAGVSPNFEKDSDAAPKSLGSKQHPYGCLECSFFLFGPNGCRAGADCNFCHELHPRKNAKKNRRIIRRFANAVLNTSPANEGNDETNGPPQESGDGRANSKDSEKTDGQLAAMVNDGHGEGHGVTGDDASAVPKGKDLPANGDEAAESADAGSPENATDQSQLQTQPQPQAPRPMRTESKEAAGNSHFATLNFSYSDTQKVILVVGLRTVLAPQMEFVNDTVQQALQKSLTFVIEPVLPNGLSLEAKTGGIVGTPKEARGLTRYVVTAKTVALGPSGIVLGTVPLTKSTFWMSVLPLHQLTLCNSRSSERGQLDEVALMLEANR